MRHEQTYHTAQAIANLLNRRIVGRSGTVYTPGSSMIVVKDDKKRARLEETAARVKVPRDSLADAIDFAGLHKDVLLGLANEVSIDAWADVWSDAVVVSSQPWGRLGPLRYHGWDLSGPHLPPLLQRSLRFDPHRWVRVGSSLSDKAFDALLAFSPKSIDLNGGFESIIQFMYAYPDDAQMNRQAEPLLQLMAGVERIHYFSDDEDNNYGFSTEILLEVVLPAAKNLREVFIRTQVCTEEWLERIKREEGHPDLVKATLTAMDGLKWVERASEWGNNRVASEAQFDGHRLIVGSERYTLFECLQKAAANPYMDVKTQICIMEWQRELANKEEQAPLALQILERLHQTQHLTFNSKREEGRLGEWSCHTKYLWKEVGQFLAEKNRSVCFGGVVFDHEDCFVSITVSEDFQPGWCAIARMLHEKGPDATIAVKYDLIQNCTPTPRILNCLDCMCYAVYPRCLYSAPPTKRVSPDDWLDFATMMKPGDHIRSKQKSFWSMNSEQHLPNYSPMDCCEIVAQGSTEITSRSRYGLGYRWLVFLKVIAREGDFTAIIRTTHWQADWRVCASLALEGPHKNESEANAIWREVADLIHSDDVVNLRGRLYTKEELKLQAENIARERKT